MDQNRLGCGDNKISQMMTLKEIDEIKFNNEQEQTQENNNAETSSPKVSQVGVTPQMIDDNETKLKERIAYCREIIESLKTELIDEKSKKEIDSNVDWSTHIPENITYNNTVSTSVTSLDSYNPETYSECVENKLYYDENILEYEKQLQKYQNTLNMAQIEKKNAIRKQMLTKAYRLKLLEVENQCNIELLRVKQSLQCLEPLQMIVNKWKFDKDDMYDASNLELIPRYPISNGPNRDIDYFQKELANVTEISTNENNNLTKGD